MTGGVAGYRSLHWRGGAGAQAAGAVRGSRRRCGRLLCGAGWSHDGDARRSLTCWLRIRAHAWAQALPTAVGNAVLLGGNRFEPVRAGRLRRSCRGCLARGSGSGPRTQVTRAFVDAGRAAAGPEPEGGAAERLSVSVCPGRSSRRAPGSWPAARSGRRGKLRAAGLRLAGRGSALPSCCARPTGPTGPGRPNPRCP